MLKKATFGRGQRNDGAGFASSRSGGVADESLRCYAFIYSIASAIHCVGRRSLPSRNKTVRRQRLGSIKCLAKLAPRLYPELTRVQAGTFQLQPGQTLAQAFTTLRSGQQYQAAITFVEGSTFAQWRAQLQSAPHLDNTLEELTEAAIADKLGIARDKLEGLLLPETYAYDVADTDIELLQRAAHAMDVALEKAWQQRADDLPIKTPYELLILASIIEKETAVASERTKSSLCIC